MRRVEMARPIPLRTILSLLHLSPGEELHCPGGTFASDDTAPTMGGDTTYSGEEGLTPCITEQGSAERYASVRPRHSRQMTLLSQPDELASVCRTHLLEALGTGSPLLTVEEVDKRATTMTSPSTTRRIPKR